MNSIAFAVIVLVVLGLAGGIILVLAFAPCQSIIML